MRTYVKRALITAGLLALAGGVSVALSSSLPVGHPATSVHVAGSQAELSRSELYDILAARVELLGHEGYSARVATQGDDPMLYFTTSAPKAVRDALQQEFGSRIVVGYELIAAV